MRERIKQVRQSMKLKQNEFAKRLLISQSQLAAIETGARAVTERTIRSICSEFSVSESWLRDGIGEMFIDNSDNIMSDIVERFDLDDLDQKIVMAYLKMNESDRGVFKQFLNQVVQEAKDEGYPVVTEEQAAYSPVIRMRRIRIVGRVAAGHPFLALDDGDEYINTPVNADCALIVSGDSMEPDYPNGSLIFVKKDVDVRSGDHVIALIMQGADIAEAAFKQLKIMDDSILLESLNPAYKALQVSAEAVRFYGKVVESQA